jgi:endonuclease YncB( thermonuclease family)
MKRNILAVALVILQPGFSVGYGWQEQDSPLKVLQQGPCGRLLGIDSCLSQVYIGKVIEVIDGGTVIAIVKKPDSEASSRREKQKTAPEEKRRFYLAGISVSSLEDRLGKEAKQKLADLVLEKSVWLSVFCPGYHGNEGFRATADVGSVDVGLDLLESGLARVDTSAISEYDKCQYELAEGRAKAAKRGLWASQ